MERYELDYTWEWKSNKLDIEMFTIEGRVIGFDKDSQGQWVKYKDVQTELNKLKERIKELGGG